MACMAEGALAAGWSAAIPGYTLAPDAGLTQIHEELVRGWRGKRKRGEC